MNTIDWKQAEAQLVNETAKAVREFAAEELSCVVAGWLTSRIGKRMKSCNGSGRES